MRSENLTMKKSLPNRWGFTLVELLVVMSIIGILMGALLVAYQGTRATARDGKRKADLEQIRTALQMYHTDCGKYPDNSGAYGLPFGGALTSTCPGSLVTYMSQLPNDPVPSNTYRYNKQSDYAYTLCALLEGGEVLTSCTESCGGGCGGGACNYKVCQP